MQEMDYCSPSSRSGQAPHGLLSSVPSPSQNRKNIQNFVPHGTVASRVLRLQGISRCFSPESQSPIYKQSPESSSASYGRREAKQFSQPPTCNSKFGGEAQRELYAIPDTGKEKRLQEAKKQMNCQRPRDQSSRDRITSICREPSSSACQTMRVIHVSSEIDKTVIEIDSMRKKGFSAAQNSTPLPSLAHSESTKLELDPRAQLQKTVSTSPSSTASTQIRKRGPDIYFEYEIESPFDLAPEGDYRATEDIIVQNYPKTCHLCSYCNKFTSIFCANCSHRLCTDCVLVKEDEINIVPKKEPSFEREKGEMSNLQLDSGNFIRRSRRPKTIPIQASGTDMSRESTKVLQNTFDSGPSSELNSFVNASKSSEQNSSVTDKSAPFLSGRNVTKSVKESPFVARDTSTSHETRPRKSSIVAPSMNESHQKLDPPRSSLNSARPDRSRASWFKSKDVNSSKKSSDTVSYKPDLAISATDSSKKFEKIFLHGAEYQSFMDRYSPSDATWSSRYTDPRETLRVLPITKSVSVKGNIEQPRIKNSLHDLPIKIKIDPKPVRILESSKEEHLQKISRNKNSSEIGKPEKLPHSSTSEISVINYDTNSPEIGEPEKPPLCSTSEISTINCNLIPQCQMNLENGRIRNDNEKKKQRRLSVAKKIKDEFSHNLVSEKSESGSQASHLLITPQKSSLETIKYLEKPDSQAQASNLLTAPKSRFGTKQNPEKPGSEAWISSLLTIPRESRLGTTKNLEKSGSESQASDILTSSQKSKLGKTKNSEKSDSEAQASSLLTNSRESRLGTTKNFKKSGSEGQASSLLTAPLKSRFGTKQNPEKPGSEAWTSSLLTIPRESRLGTTKNFEKSGSESQVSDIMTSSQKSKLGKTKNCEKSDSEAQASSLLTNTQKSNSGTIKFSNNESFDLPSINQEDHCSIWKLCSEGNLTDIVTQKIKGLVLTFELEERKDIVFRAKNWDCGQRGK